MSEPGWDAKTAGSDIIQNRWLAGIVILFALAGLRASCSVTMPLAAAGVVIAAIWPLKPWLDRVLPSKVSYIAIILALLLLSFAFVGAVYFSVAQVVRAFAQNHEQLSGIFRSVSEWAELWGVQEPGVIESYRRAISFGQSLLSNAYAILGYLGFIAILVVQGIFELPSLTERLHVAFGAEGREELVATVNDR